MVILRLGATRTSIKGNFDEAVFMFLSILIKLHFYDPDS